MGMGNMLGDLFCGPFSPACCPFYVAEAGSRDKMVRHTCRTEYTCSPCTCGLWLWLYRSSLRPHPHPRSAHHLRLPTQWRQSPGRNSCRSTLNPIVSQNGHRNQIREQNRLRSSKVIFGCSLIHHIHRCVSRLVFRISGWKLKFFPPGVVFPGIFVTSNSGALGPQPAANLWTMTGWNWVDPLLEHDSWRVHDPQQGSTGSSLYLWDLMRMGTYFQSQVVSLDSAQLILKLRRWSWKSPFRLVAVKETTCGNCHGVHGSSSIRGIAHLFSSKDSVNKRFGHDLTILSSMSVGKTMP